MTAPAPSTDPASPAAAPGPGRRRVLAASGSAALAAAGLSACRKESAGGAAASSRVEHPARVPFDGPRPDLPGNDRGVEPVYLAYPADSALRTAASEAPGDGKPVSVLTETWTTPAPGRSANQYLRDLEKDLGSRLDITAAADIGDGYLGKFNAVIASGDIPDLVWFPPNQGITRIPQLLRARFHDLAPYLGGPAAKAYPALAALPGYAWRNGAVVDGRIAGTAVTRSLTGQVYIVNRTFWQPVGGARFDSADDFLAKAADLLDRRRKRYVLEPAAVNAVKQFAQWYGAPNVWRHSGGRLTHLLETEEYAAALEFAVRCGKAGLFWPDPQLATVQEKMTGGGIGAFVQNTASGIGKGPAAAYDADVLVPFAAATGATAVHHLAPGTAGFTAVSKAVPKSRIPVLLRILDHLSAPLGTRENLLATYGEAGVHYRRDKRGDLVPTARGEAEAATTYSPINTFASPPPAVYVPGAPERSRRIHGIQQRLTAIAVQNPVLGHYSDTDTAKGAGLTAAVNNLVTDIVAGRKPMSAWKDGVRTWRTGGGDTIRTEYQRSLAHDE